MSESLPTTNGSTVCGFCKGKPVGNAASWLDGNPRSPAPCPRCGETNYPPILCHECRKPVTGLRCDDCLDEDGKAA